MVPNHTPLHVVEMFRTLEALHPGRIDLGLGRAPGTDPVTAAALRRADDPKSTICSPSCSRSSAAIPARAPVRDDHADALRRARCRRSGCSARRSPALRSPRSSACRYAFAGHFAMRHARDAIAHYRTHFEPRASFAEPYAISPSPRSAARRRGSRATRGADARRDREHPDRPARTDPLVEEALALPVHARGAGDRRRLPAGAVIGGPARRARDCPHSRRDIDANELMLSTLVPSLDDAIARST